MSNLSRSFNIKRVATIGALTAIGAFLLLAFLANLGDSDLPPYDLPFPGERFAWQILAVVAWPLVLAARFLGHDPPFVLWIPLLLVAGVFWSSLIETCIVFRHAQRA